MDNVVVAVQKDGGLAFVGIAVGEDCGRAVDGGDCGDVESDRQFTQGILGPHSRTGACFSEGWIAVDGVKGDDFLELLEN